MSRHDLLPGGRYRVTGTRPAASGGREPFEVEARLPRVSRYGLEEGNFSCDCNRWPYLFEGGDLDAYDECGELIAIERMRHVETGLVVDLGERWVVGNRQRRVTP